MNEKISWDQSLVKKYSSSNHYKMLNQLRNEVKKYPLKNKKGKQLSSLIEKEEEKKNAKTDQNSINSSLINNEINNNKSTVSFNNSKHFSIYNNVNNTTREKQEDKLLNLKNSNEDFSSATFRDRLNQIDMK